MAEEVKEVEKKQEDKKQEDKKQEEKKQEEKKQEEPKEVKETPKKQTSKPKPKAKPQPKPKKKPKPKPLVHIDSFIEAIRFKKDLGTAQAEGFKAYMIGNHYLKTHDDFIPYLEKYLNEKVG